MRKFWPFSFYFLFFAAIAAYMPYLVLYYQSLRFSGPQIGLLTGISPLITLFTVPFWTRLADRTNQHRLIVAVSLLVVVAILLIFPLLQTFLAVFAMIMISTIFLSPVLSFANSATMFMLGEDKDLYGRLRIGGSIGFGIASLAAGVMVEAFAMKAAFWVAAGLIFIGFLVSLQLKYGQEDREPIDDERGIRDLIKNPNWFFFLLIAFIGGVAFAATTGYFFPFMKELGADESAMGLALAIGTIAEIPVYLLANRFIGRFQAYGTLIISVSFAGLRLTLFGLTGNVAVVMAIQNLNGLTFPLMEVAGVSYADQNAPEGLRTTAQGLFSAAMMGIGAAVGGFLSGLLLVQIGGQGLYLVIGLAVLIVLAIVVLLRRKFPATADSSH